MTVGEEDDAPDMALIRYIVTTKIAYHAGRLAQLRASNFAYWVYRHNDAVRHPHPEHQSWDGITLPPDHPWWATHYTPNGSGCECFVVGAHSLTGARRLGGTPEKTLPAGWDSIDPATGAPPGIDEGWGCTPDSMAFRQDEMCHGKSKHLPR